MNSWIEQNKVLKKIKSDYKELAAEKYKSDHDKLYGKWNIKEVTDHMIGWEEEIIRNFIMFVTEPGKKINYNEDEFNKEAVASRASQSFIDSLEEFDEVNHKYEELIKTISEEQVEKNDKFLSWVNGYIEHYEHHIKVINES